ncbi:HAMP domain-containing histidine kinase [bacterium SCSIO 12741]|nr:HAMP domain-containing histidine kinase [bacterium SCSIO 12741]
MASLRFPGPLDLTKFSVPLDAVAQGLNWLNEELEANVVEKKTLQEMNGNLEKFAYTVSHDLKAPLNRILGLLQLIQVQKGASSPEEMEEYLALIQTCAEQMKSLIEDILSYSTSALGDQEMDRIDIQELIDEISHSYESDGNIRIQLEETPPVLLFNRVALRQIFQNLIDNAIKFCDKSNCLITIGFEQHGEMLQFSVTDNGPGIDPQILEQVFQLFFKSDQEGKEGSGIGLATVKKLVEEWGGKIWVDSEKGKGTTFFFTLDLIEAHHLQGE